MTERAVNAIITAAYTGTIDFDDFKHTSPSDLLKQLKEKEQVPNDETLTDEEETKITLTRLSITKREEVIEKYISLDEANISPKISS